MGVCHTHSSFLEESEVETIKSALDKKSYYGKTAGLLSAYIGLEAVNRVKSLSGQQFLAKVGIVAAAGLVGYEIAPWVYQRRVVNGIFAAALKNSVYVPFWKDRKNVVELNKEFFFLDDDKNFAPNLLHHGLQTFNKPDGYYFNEDVRKEYEQYKGMSESAIENALLPKNIAPIDRKVNYVAVKDFFNGAAQADVDKNHLL